MRLTQILLVILASAMLAGCELIGDIFQAGMWVGVILIVVVVAVVAFVIAKFKR